MKKGVVYLILTEVIAKPSTRPPHRIIKLRCDIRENT